LRATKIDTSANIDIWKAALAALAGGAAGALLKASEQMERASSRVGGGPALGGHDPTTRWSIDREFGIGGWHQ